MAKQDGGFTAAFRRWRDRGDEPNDPEEITPFGNPTPSTLHRSVFEPSDDKKRRKLDAQVDELLARVLLEFWHQFFASFRDDEQHFEGERFRSEAADVQQQLNALGADELPPLGLCRQMIYLLSRFTATRIGNWNERFESLLADRRMVLQDLQGLQLTSAWLSDETAHCRDMITNALKQRDTMVPNRPDGAPPTLADLVAGMLGLSAPPRPKAHVSQERRRATDPTVPDAAAESSRLRSTSKDPAKRELQDTIGSLIDGNTTLAKLNRILGDPDLAKQLYEFGAECHRNRAMLRRIGLLPEDGGAGATG